MSLRDAIYVFPLIYLSLGCLSPQSEASAQNEFLEVLRLADLDPNGWPTFDFENGDNATQSTVRQLLFRMKEFSPQQLEEWSAPLRADTVKGTLVTVRGTVTSVEPVLKSSEGNSDSEPGTLYRCEYQSNEEGERGFVLSSQIPSLWSDRRLENEPVGFTGTVLEPGGPEYSVPLILANHLSWFPNRDVSTGILLLSKQGMDVSLLDEVRHRQPFVKPEISREGEAFYACLTAMSKVPKEELASLALESIHHNANRWAKEIPELKSRLAELKKDLKRQQSATDREKLKNEFEATRRELMFASKAQERAALNLSSVAPLFLQPEQETGELVRIEGVARRAVRTAGENTAINEYFEIDVFPSDSQNLPIVCCVTQLPAEFPKGDEIRERVRLDGVFFKSWRFRTRKNNSDGGKTSGQQQLYTPVIVGRSPVWLNTQPERSDALAIAGGICFLVAIVAYWLLARKSMREEQQRRIDSNPRELPGSFDSSD